jgi:calcium-dependent protein kinase
MLQSALGAGGGIAAASGSGAQGSSANMVGGRAAATSAGGGSALLPPTASLPRAIPGGQRHPNSGRGRGRSGRSSSGTTRTAATAGSSKSSVSTNAVAATAAAPPTAAPTPPAANAPLPDLGYSRGIEDKYEWGKELGRGGNGVVRVVRDRKTGDEWACKSLPKQAPAGAGDRKRAGHLDALRREVEVLRRLEGSLNVVRLVDVYEDDEHVHLVQEWCRGGELHHRVGGRAAGFGGAAAGTAPTSSERQAHHYSERTVASFMRAVLRTLAQCHAQHILHRDVKPGNFMLLDDSERSPLRAIDFGLATPYDPDALPLDNLGLEGTPWYMAPEVLSSKVTPASDVWSAGVMAAQLLTGRLPFDDHRNPIAPSLSAVWRSVLTDEVNFNMPWWRDVSPEAREFVSALLDRDPAKRPTAREALQHPWLKGDSQDRARGKPLDASVVQRLQRFAQNSRFKRSVLQLIAEELLAAPAAGAGAGVVRGANNPSAAAAIAASAAAGGSTAGGAAAAAALLSSSADAGGSTHHGTGASTDEGGSTHHGTEAEGSSHHGTDAGGSTHRGLGSAATLGSAGSLGSGAPITRPDASPMLALLERLKFGSADYVDRRQAEEALARMGYRLEPSELGRLVDVVDSSHSGRVRRAALVASQIDWRALQRGTPGSSGSSGALRDEWLDVAARAFRALDRDGDGLLRAEEIVSSLRVKLPEDELRATLAQVMEEAGGAGVGMMGAGGAGAPQQHADALDFDGFLRMLRVGSLDSLDLYDDRLALNGGSAHGGGNSGLGGGGDSTHGRARAAAAALAAAGELTAAARAAEAKPWLRPHVSFNFNFGFDGGNGASGAAAADGEGKEAGAAADGADGAEGASALSELAASYFREPAVRGGGHFDSRMHGASLYRNNALAGSSSHAHLATVKE